MRLPDQANCFNPMKKTTGLRRIDWHVYRLARLSRSQLMNFAKFDEIRRSSMSIELIPSLSN
jgi:hypothetical protein